MPFACFAAGTRKGAFKAVFGYYVAALWPMLPGLDRYIGQSTTLVIPLAIGPSPQSCSRRHGPLRGHLSVHNFLWRAPLALLATVIPPLGIIVSFRQRCVIWSDAYFLSAGLTLRNNLSHL